jgi:hypothetical protein
MLVCMADYMMVDYGHATHAFKVIVATLALGSRPKRRLARARAKRRVREGEDEDSHSQVSFHYGSWIFGGLQTFREQLQGSKHFTLKSSLYHWKAIEV